MLRSVLVVMLAVVALAAAACGGAPAPTASAPAAVPTTAPAAKTQSDAPTKAPAQPTAAPAAKAASTQPTAAPTGAAAAKAAAPAPAAAGAAKLTLVPDGSEARFLVKEQLAGNNLPNDAIGKTKTLNGAIVVGPDGKVDKAQSKITVDVNSLKTDQPMRDGFIKQSTLETGKFPTAEFVPTEIKGLTSLPKSGDVNVQITGDMTVHGTTKPITWDVTGKVDGNTFKGTAKTAVKFEDFNMNAPKVPRVLSLENNIRLEMDFQYNIS